MPITVESLEALFPNDNGNSRSFEFDHGIERFVGQVIWREFSGVSVPERQKRVWAIIRDAFKEESQSVSLVLTFTPEEWAEINEQAESA